MLFVCQLNWQCDGESLFGLSGSTRALIANLKTEGVSIEMGLNIIKITSIGEKMTIQFCLMLEVLF